MPQRAAANAHGIAFAPIQREAPGNTPTCHAMTAFPAGEHPLVQFCRHRATSILHSACTDETYLPAPASRDELHPVSKLTKQIPQTALTILALLTSPLVLAGPVQGNGGGATQTSAGLACNISDLGGWASDCLGYVGGNDSNAALSSLAGGSSWNGLDLATLLQFKDDNVSVGGGSTNALFDVRQLSSDASGGTLTFMQDLAGPFVLTIKGGNTWAAYFRSEGASAGTTISFDIPGVQGSGLSHASIYASSGVPPQPPSGLHSVPEPGSAALVLLALAGLGCSRWLAVRRSRTPA